MDIRGWWDISYGKGFRKRKEIKCEELNKCWEKRWKKKWWEREEEFRIY